MSLRYDHTGQTFGRLEVLGYSHSLKGRGACWKCRCSCGTELVVRGESLRSGHTVSCGCAQREHIRQLAATKPAVKHGDYRTTTYRSWRDMLDRCTNPNAPNWRRYGGRGITVCNRWHSYENFLADMGSRPSGRTLNRIDNDGDYGPDNCCWSTPAEQGRNTSRTVLTEEMVLRIRDLYDRGLSRTDIARETGIGRSYLGVVVFTIQALRNEGGSATQLSH